MRLYFFRHGIAEAGHAGLRDFDRPLTDEGRDELATIARGLRRLRVGPDVLLSSPLVRARQTAEIIAPMLGMTVEIADELKSGANFAVFQGLVSRYSGSGVLMFVGHEPGMSEYPAALLGADGGAIVLKKAGLIRVDLDGRCEPGRGRLRWLLTPRQLELIGAGADVDSGAEGRLQA